jgi:chorismate mutase/prephenate dehydratase
MKVAYLGPNEKTYTGQFTRHHFLDAERIPIQPIRGVIMAVENNEVDLCTVPVENLHSGEVRDTLDTLTECHRARIVREGFFDIYHYLGALKNHEEITKIFSKDEALNQCSRYLYGHYPSAQTIGVTSTEEAVQRIIREQLLDTAAIASKESVSGLEILAAPEELCPDNRTRFFVIGVQPTLSTGRDKTFLAIHPRVRDRPGVLHDVLGFFRGLGINLEYILSRPDRSRELKGYYFYIELDGHETDERVIAAINSARLSLDPHKKHADTIKILGSYPDSMWKNDN